MNTHRRITPTLVRSTGTRETSLTHRVAALVALFAMVSALILPARHLQVSGLAHDAMLLGAGAAPVSAPPVDAEEAQARAQEAYGKLPIQFEANHGQTDARVKFITRASGATVFLTATETVFVLSAPDENAARAAVGSPEDLSERDLAPMPRKMHALRMTVEGAHSAPLIEGLDKLPGVINYFIGDDAAKWHTDIPTFGRIRYENVYEGVDLVYYGNQQQLEYDFVVAPTTTRSRSTSRARTLLPWTRAAIF
jgi:hypothetical protein